MPAVVKGARVCARPAPPRPPTPACTPQASVDISQQPAGSLGPGPNSEGAANELGGACLGEGRRLLPLPLGKRKQAPNRPPAWTSGISSPGESLLSNFL